MNTKKLALTIVFAALTVALNPAISKIGIPAPYAPYLIYGLWEIPIVAAFLLIGPKSGIAISLLNTLVLFAFYQGIIPAGPFYNLAAVMSMLLGVFIANKLFSRNSSQVKQAAMIVTAATILGIVFREIVMTIINYVTLQQPYPFGLSFSELVTLSTLPATAIFNGTVVLYTIPLAYILTRVIQRSIRLNLDYRPQTPSSAISPSL
jgi:riboflavin transporter FmnP